MGWPIDNSTDPPFRDLSVKEVETEFGPLSTMSPSLARDALSSFCAPHWLQVAESDFLLRELAKKAGILHDFAALADLGLEKFYVANLSPS